MKARWLVVGTGVSFALACSLNPQPLPPGTYDGGATGVDASVEDSGATFGEAGATPDAQSDAALPPDDDASVDSGDASDAGDANQSDAADGSEDAEPDAADDAESARDDGTD